MGESRLFFFGKLRTIKIAKGGFAIKLSQEKEFFGFSENSLCDNKYRKMNGREIIYEEYVFRKFYKKNTW